MRDTKTKGSIVNVSTQCAQLAVANLVAYGTSKAGIHGMTKQLAIELAPEFRTDPPLRSLFQLGDFTLRSGQKSKWKIECDGLTGDDWSALAQMAVEILPPFGGVAGVPRGGWPFAAALALRATPGCKTFLVAEDVITTGGSILRYLEANPPPKDQWEHVLGVCVFARGPVSTPDWVTPLFSMPLGKVAFAAKTS